MKKQIRCMAAAAFGLLSTAPFYAMHSSENVVNVPSHKEDTLIQAIENKLIEKTIPYLQVLARDVKEENWEGSVFSDRMLREQGGFTFKVLEYLLEEERVYQEHALDQIYRQLGHYCAQIIQLRRNKKAETKVMCEIVQKDLHSAIQERFSKDIPRNLQRIHAELLSEHSSCVRDRPGLLSTPLLKVLRGKR